MRKSGDLPKTVQKINTFGGKADYETTFFCAIIHINAETNYRTGTNDRYRINW